MEHLKKFVFIGSWKYGISNNKLINLDKRNIFLKTIAFFF